MLPDCPRAVGLPASCPGAVLSDQKVVDIVLDHWGDAAAAASTIVRTALSTGSGDNLTAQVRGDASPGGALRAAMVDAPCHHGMRVPHTFHTTTQCRRAALSRRLADA